MTTDEPTAVKELRRELESIRGRLAIAEEALKELVECYESLVSGTR